MALGNDGGSRLRRPVSVQSFEELEYHVGHEVEVVTYGGPDSLRRVLNIAIECIECSEVLLDFDRNYHEFEEQG